MDTVGTLSWQQEAAEAGRQEPELLDPVADLRVNAFDLVGDIRRQQRLLAHRAAMPAHWCAAPSLLSACRALVCCAAWCQWDVTTGAES